MGCTSSKTLDTVDSYTPPDPKDGMEFVAMKPPTVKDLRGSISMGVTTTNSVTDGSIASASGDDNVVDGVPVNKTDTWRARRNSQKEKEHYLKRKMREARIELGRRVSQRAVVPVKCPKCGDKPQTFGV